MTHLCPKCGHVAVTRNSKRISAIAKEATVQCTNPQCSCSFVVISEAVRIINPGVWPLPLAELPVSTRKCRK